MRHTACAAHPSRISAGEAEEAWGLALIGAAVVTVLREVVMVLRDLTALVQDEAGMVHLLEEHMVHRQTVEDTDPLHEDMADQ